MSSAWCCRDDGAFYSRPRGSVRFRVGIHVHDASRPLAPAELSERLPSSSSTPRGAVWELPAADTPFAGYSWGLSAVSHVERHGSDLVHISDGETGPISTSSPFPDLWCLPWDRTTDQGFVSSTWTQDAASQASLYFSSVSLAVACTWCSPSPVTGQPSAQLAPLPGPSAAAACIPDTVGRPSTVFLPQFQAVDRETRPNPSPTTTASAGSMPHPLLPGSRPADVDVLHQMDFTQVQGGPRPLLPAQGFPLPSYMQPLPVYSPSTGLPGAQDFTRLQTTGRLTSQPQLQDPVASSVARSGLDPLEDMQSILAAMQDTFLQQVKGLLGEASPQPSLGPSVPTDMGQDALQQPNPADNQEAFRAGPKTGSKRAGESSRSWSRSGDLSPSERRDGWSRSSCRRSLNSCDTPYGSCSQSPPKRHREHDKSPGCHHSRSLAGSWCTSPPGCRGSRSRSPATFRQRHSPSPPRWLSALTSHSASLSSTALEVSYNFMQRVILMFWSAVAKGKIDEMVLMLDLFDLPKNKLYNHEGTANVTWLCDDAYRTLHASTYAVPSHCLWISRGWPSSKGQRQTHNDVSRRQWPFRSSCPQGRRVEEGPRHRVGNVHSYTAVTEQAKASRKLSRPASSSRPPRSMAHQSPLDAIPAPKSRNSYRRPAGPYQSRKDSFKGSGDNKSQNRQLYKQRYSGYSAKGKPQSKDQSKSSQSQNRSEGSSRQDKDCRTSQQSRNCNKSKQGRGEGSGQRP